MLSLESMAISSLPQSGTSLVDISFHFELKVKKIFVFLTYSYRCDCRGMDSGTWVNDVSLRLASRRIESEPRQNSHTSASFCSLCSRQFLSPEARARHVAISPAHPRCAPCNRQFLDARALANHLSGSRNHRQAHSRRDNETMRDPEAAIPWVQTTDVRPVCTYLSSLQVDFSPTLSPYASQQIGRGNSSSTSARRRVSISSFFTSDQPSTSEPTTYTREVRPSLARPTFLHRNAPVSHGSIHPSIDQQLAQTMVETLLSTAVPTVQLPEPHVNRGEENEERNENSSTGETSESEGSIFVSFFRSLWGWSNNTETQPPGNQTRNSQSTQSVSTIRRSSETSATERSINQYKRDNDPEEGYKCPLCWDKKTHLSSLRCGHVFCTSYVLSNLEDLSLAH